MIATPLEMVEAINKYTSEWGAFGIAIAAVISWIGANASGVILAVANGRIAKAADKTKDVSIR